MASLSKSIRVMATCRYHWWSDIEQHCLNTLEGLRRATEITQFDRQQQGRVVQATVTARYRGRADIAKGRILAILSKYGWTVSSLDTGECPLAERDDEAPVEHTLPMLTQEVLDRHFNHLYNVDAYIRLIWDATQSRQHVLLYGEPGVAKSRIYLAFARWLGTRLWRLDAPTLTKAGLENEIIKKAKAKRLPPILCVEEIEKCTNANLACLLQLMDDRSRIQKTTNRGDVCINANVTLWATANDTRKLARAMGGALASRFACKLEVRKPDYKTLYIVLNDKARDMGLTQAHVDAVYDFMLAEAIGDTRIGVFLLSGRDRLFNGFLEDYKLCKGTM